MHRCRFGDSDALHLALSFFASLSLFTSMLLRDFFCNIDFKQNAREIEHALVHARLIEPVEILIEHKARVCPRFR